MAEDERPFYEQVVGWLLRSTDRVAVDVGCGGGGMTLALAGAMDPNEQVVAVDAEPEVLSALRDRLDARHSAAAEVTLVAADFGKGVDEVRSAMARPADLVWASASVHHLGDQQAA